MKGKYLKTRQKSGNMESESLLLSICREQKRHYMGALRQPRNSRIDARHRVVMLKDMPYRDISGRILAIQPQSESKLSLHRRNSPAKKLVLPLLRLSISRSPEKKQVGRLEKGRSQRETRCEFVINSCRELSTSREHSPTRSNGESPVRKPHARTQSGFEIR